MFLTCDRTPALQQIWDPTIGAFRDQNIPLSLSKSSMSGFALDGRPSTPASQRSASSFTTHVSGASSMMSIPSTFSRRSFPRSSGSYTSQNSYNSHSSQRSSIFPPHIFETLPPEIYDAIVNQLGKVHRERELESCQTCYLRDLCALSLTSHAWDKAVVKVM